MFFDGITETNNFFLATSTSYAPLYFEGCIFKPALLLFFPLPQSVGYFGEGQFLGIWNLNSDIHTVSDGIFTRSHDNSGWTALLKHPVVAALLEQLEATGYRFNPEIPGRASFHGFLYSVNERALYSKKTEDIQAFLEWVAPPVPIQPNDREQWQSWSEAVMPSDPEKDPVCQAALNSIFSAVGQKKETN